MSGGVFKPQSPSPIVLLALRRIGILLTLFRGHQCCVILSCSLSRMSPGQDVDGQRVSAAGTTRGRPCGCTIIRSLPVCTHYKMVPRKDGPCGGVTLSAYYKHRAESDKRTHSFKVATAFRATASPTQRVSTLASSTVSRSPGFPRCGFAFWPGRNCPLPTTV